MNTINSPSPTAGHAAFAAPSSKLEIIKKHSYAAFFLSSGIASALLLVFFLMGQFQKNVSFETFVPYSNGAFSVSLPQGLEFSQRLDDTWIFTVEDSPAQSPVVMTVAQSTLLNLAGATQEQKALFIDGFKDDLDDILDETLEQQGVSVARSASDSFEHDEFPYAFKYIADATNQQDTPITVVGYALVDESGNMNFVAVLSSYDLNPLKTEKVDVIAHSFEVNR